MLLTQGTVATNGTATLLARVVGWNAEALTPADVESVAYTVYEQSPRDPTSRTALSAHSALTAAVAEVLFSELQTDDRWTVDSHGYNFRHTVPLAAGPLFVLPATQWVVEYVITPHAGEPIVVLFLLRSV